MQGAKKGKWMDPSKVLPLVDGYYICLTSTGSCVRYYSHRDREFQSSWADAKEVTRWLDQNADEPGQSPALLDDPGGG